MVRSAIACALIASPVAAAPEFVTSTYKCDPGVEIPATYVNAADGRLVVLHVDGRQITLLAEPSGSAGRYAWPSDGSGYVWWTKSNSATLYWKTPEGEALLLTCTAVG